MALLPDLLEPLVGGLQVRLQGLCQVAGTAEICGKRAVLKRPARGASADDWDFTPSFGKPDPQPVF
jgi:hypothetical protein